MSSKKPTERKSIPTLPIQNIVAVSPDRYSFDVLATVPIRDVNTNLI